MIVITSKKDGFRRCGIAHAAKATSYPNRRFSKEQLAILQAETMLTVVVTEETGKGKTQPKA
ncbi:HI1506-related protein [Desulfocastanea catecholica]